MVYMIKVTYDGGYASSKHSGIPEDRIDVLVSAFSKRKIITIEGKNNSFVIDFSKVIYMTYERE